MTDDSVPDDSVPPSLPLCAYCGDPAEPATDDQTYTHSGRPCCAFCYGSFHPTAGRDERRAARNGINRGRRPADPPVGWDDVIRAMEDAGGD